MLRRSGAGAVAQGRRGAGAQWRSEGTGRDTGTEGPLFMLYVPDAHTLALHVRSIHSLYIVCTYYAAGPTT